MNSKKILILIIVVILILIGGLIFLIFNNKNISSDAIKFKEEYESLNGKENARGLEYRTVSISEDNPFIYITPEDLIKKMENSETFYVYFGSELCPWCRSVIEKSIEVAKNYNIDAIYYIDIWNEDGEEILRDKYSLKDDTLVLEKEGTEEYYKILDLLDDVLSEYILTDENGNEISTDEKRIYAPSFLYIENGEAKKFTTGTSDKQTDSRETLTEEMLYDEENKFSHLFDN